MAERFERRTYDILRLIDEHEPIGSIRLVDLMQRHGYSIKGRTVRLVLAELDDRGVTKKVPGRGRELTDAGRDELARGDVRGRLEQIRAHIATLTSQVTYDPIEDVGEMIASSVTITEDHVEEALALLGELASSPLAPLPLSVDAVDGRMRFRVPSSLTVDGVLLSRGIHVDLQTAGLAEYHPEPDEVPYDDPDAADHGGAILRYTDAISGEGSTVDVANLLVEARRTSVRRLVDGDPPAVVVVDNRELPLARYGEARDLATATRDHLGGVLDLRRPREEGPFPVGELAWDFASLTYGAGEIVLSLLVESGLTSEWRTLDGLVARGELNPYGVVAAEWGVE